MLRSLTLLLRNIITFTALTIISPLALAYQANFIIQGNGASVFNSGAGPVTHVGGGCTVNGSPC